MNLITDIAGIAVGHANDAQVASGVTALIFASPATASCAVHGGAPGLRDTALLAPEMTVDKVDALVLSGGSAFGLDAMGGVMAHLRGEGRGFQAGSFNVPIVPGAILFDLMNGGDKSWGNAPLYWHLGLAAAQAAKPGAFALGTQGAGYGATTANLKGGLGSASAMTSGGFLVGALVAVNAVGSATIGDGAHFWAAPYEQGGEFGGLGVPHPWPADAGGFKIKGDAPTNTTIAIVATDAAMSKSEAKRLAVMAQDGLAHALRPIHGATDGDTVFAAATGAAQNPSNSPPSIRDLIEIGMVAADCLARAIARGIYEATPLPFAGALPSWKTKFGG